MKRLVRSGESSLYEVPGAGPGRMLVASTAASRQVLTDPAVCGLAYRRLVHTSVADALRTLVEAGDSALGGTIATLDVLRGGLSFGVADAIGEVLGIDPVVSFIGTERSGDRPIRLTYPRWELGDADTLVIGDIIGTGSTLIAVLSEALGLAARQGHPLRSIVVFTIGSGPGIRRLADHLAGAGSGIRLTVVALEALFELPDLRLGAGFPRLPFDLLRSPASSAPEFERQRLQSLGSLFERCAIYDGGVRAFTPAEHASSRARWWSEVVRREVPLAELATLTAGLTVYRLPYRHGRKPVPWLDDATAAELHALGRAAWRYAESATVSEYLAGPLREHVVTASPA